MSPEHFDDPLEVEFLALLELVPAGADPTGCRRGPQESDLLLGCGREVEQFFLENALDAEVSGVNGAKGPGMPPAGLDDPAERVVDDAGRPSRLGDDDVASGHGSIDPFKVEVGGVQASIGLAHRSYERSGRHHLSKIARPFPSRLQHAVEDQGKPRATRPACTPGLDPLTAFGAGNKMGPQTGRTACQGSAVSMLFRFSPPVLQETPTPWRPCRGNHCRSCLHARLLPSLCTCLGLFAVGLAINIALVQCANAQFWLTGEEASVAFKDVVFLRLRLQHCRYDTNLGGHILYFLAHAVHPDPGLWYGRETKAVLMALAGPLTYLFARRLGLGFVASTFSGLCIFLFPGFSSFSWIGMEAGLELLFGGLALYLAYGRSIWTWPLAAASLGFGILVYGGGAAFVVPVLGLIGWRVWCDRDRRSLICALAAVGVFVGVLSLPSLWWVNTSHAYRGGGTIELVRTPVLFLRLLYESFLQAAQLLLLFNQSCPGRSTALAPAGRGSVRVLPQGFHVVAALAACSGIHRPLQHRNPDRCASSDSSGVRRISAPGRGARMGRPIAAVVEGRGGDGLSCVLSCLLGSQTLATARALSDQRLVLPRDFDWIGADMKLL